MVVLILLVVSLARNPGTEPTQFGHDRCSAGQYSAANALFPWGSIGAERERAGDRGASLS